MCWAKSSNVINNSHLIHCTGFLYPLICTASWSAKSASFECKIQGILLNAALWYYFDTCLWWNKTSHSHFTPILPVLSTIPRTHSSTRDLCPMVWWLPPPYHKHVLCRDPTQGPSAFFGVASPRIEAKSPIWVLKYAITVTMSDLFSQFSIGWDVPTENWSKRDGS